MLYIVDGTGPVGDEAYRQKFACSFCSLLHEQIPERSVYMRGPSIDGLAVGIKASAVAAMIANLPAGEPVFLCGYSRGGATAINIAARLKRPVKAMFLFDAVDRDVLTDATVIPANVIQAYHAMRDPSFAKRHEASVDELRKAMLVEEMASNRRALQDGHLRPLRKKSLDSAQAYSIAKKKSDDLKRRSRFTFLDMELFGNCGESIRPPGRLDWDYFPGTHGALGGDPWPDIDGDRDVVPRVRSWMWSRLIAEGVVKGVGLTLDEIERQTQRAIPRGRIVRCF